MSGERTSVGESRSIAASWYVRDFPAPVGITASVSLPAERSTYDGLLSRPKVVEPEELAKRGTKIGHPNECTVGGGALPCRLRAVPVTRA